MRKTPKADRTIPRPDEKGEIGKPSRFIALDTYVIIQPTRALVHDVPPEWRPRPLIDYLDGVDVDGCTPVLLAAKQTNFPVLLALVREGGAVSDICCLAKFLCANISVSESAILLCIVACSVDATDHDDNTILHFVAHDTDAFSDHYIMLFEHADMANAAPGHRPKSNKVEQTLVPNQSPFAAKINSKNKVRRTFKSTNPHTQHAHLTRSAVLASSQRNETPLIICLPSWISPTSCPTNARSPRT